MSILGITGGNDDSRYSVEKGSGTIIIAKALDAEQQLNYNLTVEATDGTRSISTQVFRSPWHMPKRGGNNVCRFLSAE